MGNTTTLDEKTTDYLGSRMDPKHEGLLKKILAKWRDRGEKTTKGAIVDAGVELVAKQEGLYPDCHLVTAEIMHGLWDEEAKLRDMGYDDDDFGNEGVRSFAARHNLLEQTKIIIDQKTTVIEGA
jgi:hypothetical protein